MSRILMTVCALALLTAGAIYLEEYPTLWPAKAFSSAEWTKTPHGERYVFVKDIIDRDLLRSKSRSDVEGLLGKPSAEIEKNRISYLVKIGGRGFKQVFSLEIQFNPATGLVERAFIAGD